MGYLDTHGLSTFWTKIKNYIANYHDNTKQNKVYYQSSEPSGAQIGDIWVDSDEPLNATHVHNQYIQDAPADGNQYARQNNAWAVVQGGSGGGGNVPDATKLIKGQMQPYQYMTQLEVDELDDILDNDIEINGQIVADFIVDYGVNEIWEWRKWSSGLIEAWGFYEDSFVCDTSALGGYRSDDVTIVIPPMMTKIKTCLATSSGTTGSGYASILRTRIGPSDNYTTIKIMMLNTSKATVTVTASLYVTGE